MRSPDGELGLEIETGEDAVGELGDEICESSALGKLIFLRDIGDEDGDTAILPVVKI